MKDHIILKNITFCYRLGNTFFSKKKKEVLNNISFNVKAGETLGIIGRNGAGKSTLLRLLSDIITPNEGSIIRNCKKINLLSIELGFSEQLSGMNNIILSGLFNGFSKKEIVAKIDDVIEMSGIGESVHNNLITYSSGMRARLGFSIAYHLEPDVLLIDEILGVGDIDFQLKSERLIKEKMNSNQTVVLVTHDPDLVKDVCDRVIWIEHGNIMKQGDTHEVMNAYLEYMLQDSPETLN